MKIKKIIAGLSATVLASTMMAVSASAVKLSDVVYPSETDTKMNDSYYSIGGMPFFMNQTWRWNQGEWVGIDDTGKLTFEYKISSVLADKTMSGKGTLGDMGVMITNLPDDVYPLDVKISDAKFVTDDGETIVFDSINSLTSLDEDSEGGIRIHIRPTDEVDEDTGEVTKKACPEAAGWEKEGSFNGGTFTMTFDFGVTKAANDDTSKADSSSKSNDSSKIDTSSSKADTSKKDTASSAASASSAVKNTSAASTSSKTSDDTAKAANTGVAVGGSFAVIAIAGTVVIVAKKRK